ncbi:MAG TPA: DUF4142 domain-containing protein [Polyangiaceae bacterium]|nr:DUF4142 domain-containing protein [Polyangiaceae bacterium]
MKSNHSMGKFVLVNVVGLAVCLGAVACTGSSQEPPATQDQALPSDAPAEAPAAPAAATPTTPSTPTPATTDAPIDPPPVDKVALTEPQIALLADLANTSEIEQGQLAQKKAKAPGVQSFAGMMVRHHTQARQEQSALFKKLSITPAESSAAAQLKADAAKTLDSLKQADAASFDAAYTASQVDAHQKVLDLIDKEMLPAATQPALADGLRKMKETVQSHLTEAKSLQAKLNK